MRLASLMAAGMSCLIPIALPAQEQAPPIAVQMSPQAAQANSPAPVVLTLDDALARARANSPQFQAALTSLGLAREDRIQARAAMLPSVDYNNGFIYTQPNGHGGFRFIANNGVHEYISQGAVQQAFGLGLIADYQRTAAAQALARARAEIAARGLNLTVVQAYYGLLAAQAKTASTQAANDEAQRFLDLSRKLENGGEVAHSDVIKAQIQANDQRRLLDEARLAEQNARLSLAVLLFPNFSQDFTLAGRPGAGTAAPGDE